MILGIKTKTTFKKHEGLQCVLINYKHREELGLPEFGMFIFDGGYKSYDLWLTKEEVKNLASELQKLIDKTEQPL